jgi:tetratricopeptide (TPR) repeat protein
MIAAAERAVELNPSLSIAYASLGLALGVTGRPDEAVKNLEKAMRLSPRDSHIWLSFHGMAMVRFVERRYGETVEWAKCSIQRNPRFPLAWRLMAASYAHLGRMDEAHKALEEMFRLQPEFSLAAAKPILSTAHPDFVERLFEGLRKLGLKE